MVRLPEGWREDPKAQELILAKLRKAHEAKFGRGAQFPTAGDLAKALDPKTVQTPALDVIDEALEWAYTTPNARLIVSMPPQEGKSQRVTKTGTLWALLRDPERRMAIVSYSQELAESFGREIRNWIVSNDGTDGTLDLGVRIARDNGAVRRWQLAGHRGSVTSVGIGGALTGRPVDALVIDDPLKDADQADSLYFRDRVWNWWTSVGATRLAPGAPVIVIMTRWHEDDLAGRLIANEDGHIWRVINIPALADHNPENGQSDLLGREPGQWLDSARKRTTEEWEAIRVRVGSRVFNALYQGRPSPETGDVWKRQWWRRYNEPLWSDAGDGKSWTADVDEMLISGDLTFKDTKSSDFVVLQVWGKKGANAYLLDQIHKRMSFTETLKALTDLCARWPQANAKLVEDKANGPAVIDLLSQKIPGIIPVEPHGSKYARANAVAPFIEAGNVLLPSASVALFDVDGLIEEAAAFPNGTHDDQVDGISQALDRLFVRGDAGSAFLEYLRRDVTARGLNVPTESWRDRARNLQQAGGLNAAASAAGRPLRQPPHRNDST